MQMSYMAAILCLDRPHICTCLWACWWGHGRSGPILPWVAISSDEHSGSQTWGPRIGLKGPWLNLPHVSTNLHDVFRNTEALSSFTAPWSSAAMMVLRSGKSLQDGKGSDSWVCISNLITRPCILERKRRG